MKYLITQITIFLAGVGSLLYFFSLNYFLPYGAREELNWYSIAIVLFLLFLVLQSIVSLGIFLTQKFLAYGPKEFPDYRVSLRWGLGVGLGLVTVLLLNTLHIVAIEWGVVLLILVIAAIIII